MDNLQLKNDSSSEEDIDIKEEPIENNDRHEEMLWDDEAELGEAASERQSSEEQSDSDEEVLKPPETIFLQMKDEPKDGTSEDEMDPLAQNDENSNQDGAVKRDERGGGLSFTGLNVEAEEVLAILLLLRVLRKRRKRRKREFWVRPSISERHERGSYHFLFNELVKDSEKFFNYFRMSLETFNELYGILEESLRFQNTTMRCAISAKERLVVTLRYLASGCTLTELHSSFRIGISTLGGIVKDTCQKIWNILQTTALPVPTEKKWKETAHLFWERANFPNCVGAISGKCIQIAPLKSSGSYKYKKFTSVVLVAACDANYCFTLVDLGTSYSDILDQSNISKLIASKGLNLPSPHPLPNTSSPPFPFVMVGNEAFALSKNVMRPYASTRVSETKRVFNYRLTRAQRFIECTFGILSNKWHILHRPFNVREEFAIDIVKACVILHNFVRVRDGFLFEDTLTQVGLVDFDIHNNQRSKDASGMREHLANYFVGIGSVPWQTTKI